MLFTIQKLKTVDFFPQVFDSNVTQRSPANDSKVFRRLLQMLKTLRHWKQSTVGKKTIRGGRSELFRGGFSPSFQFQRWLVGVGVDNLSLSAPAGCVYLDSGRHHLRPPFGLFPNVCLKLAWRARGERREGECVGQWRCADSQASKWKEQVISERNKQAFHQP